MSDFNTVTGLGEPGERTEVEPDAGITLFRTQGGGVRGSRYYAATRYLLKVYFDYCTTTQVTAIMGHFDGAPTSDHTITIDGITYNFNYMNRPMIVGFHGQHRHVAFEAEGWIT